MALRISITKLQSLVEPKLHGQGLKWSDVQPMLECVDSLDEVQHAFNDSESFLKKLLVGAGDQVARRTFLIKVKPVVEPYLQ